MEVTSTRTVTTFEMEAGGAGAGAGGRGGASSVSRTGGGEAGSRTSRPAGSTTLELTKVEDSSMDNKLQT